MFLRMIGFSRLRGKVLFLNNTVLHAIFYQRCLIATDILEKLLVHELQLVRSKNENMIEQSDGGL